LPALRTGHPIARVRAGETIKIGFVSPQTGPLAPFGEADAYIIGQMPSCLRGRRPRRQESGGKDSPEDSQSSPNRAGEVANDLILKEKIDLMLVSSTPETTTRCRMPATERDSVHLHRGAMAAVVLRSQGDPAKASTGLITYSGAGRRDRQFPRRWKSVQTNKKVGGLFPNDGDGNAGRQGTRVPGPLAKEASRCWTRAASRTLNNDFSAQIAAFKKATSRS